MSGTGGRAWIALIATAAGLVAVAALTGGLLAMFGPSVGMLYGLSDLGPVVDAGLPAARVIALGAAAATFGSLLLAAVLFPGDPYGTVSPRGYAGLRMARRWATVQAVASTVVAVLTAAENASIAPARLLGWLTALFSSIDSVEQASGWAIAAVIAAVVALGAGWVLSWRSAVGLLVLAVVGLLPITLTTATNAEQSHDWAGDALTLHVLAAVVWLGSTLAVVVELAGGQPATAAMLRRHGVIATWSLLVVGGYGLVSAVLAINPLGLFGSGYGLMVLASMVSIVLLGGLAVAGRWARVAARARSRRAAARWLAGVELVLLAAAAAAGTALTRLFPPAQAGYQPSRLVYLLGYELPPHLTAPDLVLHWRLDLVFGPLAVLAAASYLLGVRRIRASGRSWPAARTACWLSGCAVLLVATSSGLGSYGHAVFSVHMVTHMLLATLVPVLLVLGHGVTLALEATSTGLRTRLLSLLDAPAVRFARHPAVAWAAVAVTLFGLYPTGLFGAIVLEHWAHLGMDAAFLGTGLALFWPVLGYSLPERGLPAIGRIVMVFAVMALHAGFSAWLLSRATPIAGQFYTALRLPFVSDLLADQRRGAVLGWALGEVPVLIAVLALVVRWTRADRAESERAAATASWAATARPVTPR
jgi:cytochrome c oxidase assembly factor CtaG/putative copper export protein